MRSGLYTVGHTYQNLTRIMNSYATLFRIASGQMLGANQPVELRLLELPQGMKVPIICLKLETDLLSVLNGRQALEGVVMEINDCAFPLVKNIVATDNAEEAFEGCNVALLVW